MRIPSFLQLVSKVLTVMASNEIEWDSVTFEKEFHDLRLSVTIQNFLGYLSIPEQKLESPEMECSQRCGAKWILQVYPHGDGTMTTPPIDVFLKLTDKPFYGEVVLATYDIYILLNEAYQITRHPTLVNTVEKELRQGTKVSLRKDYIWDQREKDIYVPNGNLTIRCEGKVLINKSHRKATIENLPQTISSNHYSNLLKKMYEEKICWDFVLKSGSSEFKCHKNILAAASTFFKAMFQHDMKENRENEVDLSKDLNGEELKGLLDFIYLGKREIQNLPQASYQTLYRMADMYEIDGLAEACEKELIGLLNNDNAADLLSFSVEFWAKRLKKAAASIIAKCAD